MKPNARAPIGILLGIVVTLLPGRPASALEIGILQPAERLASALHACDIQATLLRHRAPGRNIPALKQHLQQAEHAFAVLDLAQANLALRVFAQHIPRSPQDRGLYLAARTLQARLANLQEQTSAYDEAITALALWTYTRAHALHGFPADIAADIAKIHAHITTQPTKPLGFAPRPVSVSVFGELLSPPVPDQLPGVLHVGVHGWYPEAGWVPIGHSQTPLRHLPHQPERFDRKIQYRWTHDGKTRILQSLPDLAIVWRADEPEENLCRHLVETKLALAENDAVRRRRRNALIWSSVVSVAGGVAAAIAVPIRNRPDTGGIRITWDP